MDLALNNKVVAITGGSTGIGAAVALGFAKEGSLVAVCGRNQSKLDTLKDRFKSEGFELFTFSADVGDVKQLRAFISKTAEHYGRLDILINNAGTNIRKDFREYTEEEFDTIVNCNLRSVFFGSAAAAEIMKKNGGGVIINTSSFTSVIPTADVALYSATKSAVESLTRTMAAALAPDHIRVNSVIPGYIRTPLTEKNIEKNEEKLLKSIALNRLGEPEDLVGAYLFLASDMAASYVDGISLAVSGAKFCVQDPQWAWNNK